MENLPETLCVDPATPPLPPTDTATFDVTPIEASSSISQSATVDELIRMLYNPNLREEAMELLNKKRESCAELPIQLWNSFNTVYILLQEVISLYKKLSPLRITTKESTRVCNALALIQCMAAHPDTRMGLVRAKIPAYLYPFLEPTVNEKPLEFLRLTSLGVIGALVKIEDSNAPEVVHFLLETEVFPLCLRCIDLGDELTQSVAALIVMKILIQEEGLNYCCALAERFFSVVQVLGRLVERLPETPCLRLLRYVVRCYLRLSELPSSLRSMAMETFRRCLPSKLTDERFLNVLHDDPQTARMLQQFFLNITTSSS
nr:cell differentiation protein rcd1-like [Ipomoea batatas]